ncbi:MAG: Asp-tRNA(Asn)/Glu-tRNA(Gln) amidotransferase subunit GatC [Oscillospiraceae bacterium]|jgi:aspartyl-tRNA(Asn)/glutamyl-tRNA(Gln) amidotransferase subunit C|nr:Asp-tRNA(Asn)/Glu-tRNA(Gln) amidotransferase subunit GatC [Oscillospiraceae bacterium]
MQIDGALIAYLEDLSRLSLSDAEKTRLAGDLTAIVGYMAKLDELDTAGVPERSHPFDHTNAFRADVVGDSFDRALILRNAPDAGDEAFRVPKTVE